MPGCLSPRSHSGTLSAWLSPSALPAHGALSPSDLYEVDDLLGDDERLIRDTVRAFVRERALPVIPEHFEAGTFPRELIAGLAELGLLGMHLRGYGCAGTSAIAYGVASEELEAGDSGLRSFVSVQGSLAMFPIWAYGSEEQKTRWLPEMAAGRAIGCFGLTEPDAGSDPSSMRTSARRDGDDWILDGTKMWITNGSMADIAVVWARTDGGVRGFLVERGMRGFTTSDVHNKLSLRASVTSELSFDAGAASQQRRAARRDRHARTAVVSQRGAVRHRLGRDGRRARVLRGGARLQQGPARIRQADRRDATHAAEARRHGDVHHPGPVARAPARHAQGRGNAAGGAGVGREARQRARGTSTSRARARTILGANGITLEYPVSRHMANLESVLTYEGTEEVHTLIIGKELTGENAFS